MHHLASPLLYVGKGRGKKKKGAVPRPPPLLLVQDVEAAQNRRQERAAALLLCNRPPSPPTPTRCPSSLPGWGGAAPLWQKSSLLEEDSTHQSDLYTHELRGFFTLSEAATVRRDVNNCFQGDCFTCVKSLHRYFTFSYADHFLWFIHFKIVVLSVIKILKTGVLTKLTAQLL